MAWRPTEVLIEGMLDNTTPNKVTGWMIFSGMKVTFDLEGNFHRDIRGAKIRFTNEASESENAVNYMEGFSSHQTGKVGDMTAGLPPQDFGAVPYLEWFGDANGRCVIELKPDQVELLTPPIPAMKSDPISRKQQEENMAEFLGQIAGADGVPQEQEQALAIGNTVEVERAKKVVANDKLRGMKLLTKEIRDILPPLYAQEDKGRKAVVFTKFFTPDGAWTFWATEFDGKDTFFGLVDGHEKELGYFSLSELESVNGPMGLPIERDLYWKPKTLEEIAPEMFRKEEAK